MATSSIEWTEHTWNPVRGCTKVSPGCANCYAETFAERWRGVKGHAYEQGFDLRLVPDKLDEPLGRLKPTTYFVNSMSDLFHEDVPDAYIVRVFAMMASAHQHRFQILTKRAERMRNLLKFFRLSGPAPFSERVYAAYRQIPGHKLDELPWPLPNVWLGVSVENQHFADERIPLLLDTPSAVRFISAEPLLEQIDLTKYLWTIPGARLNHLHWIIVGGESGAGARPFDLAWARSIVAQCRAGNVPVFVKQVGSSPALKAYETRDYGSEFQAKHGNKRIRLIDRKGGDMAEWPADLRVREFPASQK